MLLKCCIQYASKFGKLGSGHRIGKGQFSSQSQRNAMPKSTIALISHAQNSPSQASTVHEHQIPDVQAGFKKGRGIRDQNANIHWITEKQTNKQTREFYKTIYFFFVDYAKAFDCVDHNKLWKILQEMGIPDHLT